MIWKYLGQNVLFPKDLNWVQHWVSRIDHFGLYILFSHFRPRDATRGNSFFQMSSYARANLRITNEFPWGHHVVWNGKTKCTSRKGLLVYGVIYPLNYLIGFGKTCSISSDLLTGYRAIYEGQDGAAEISAVSSSFDHFSANFHKSHSS